MAAKRRKRGIGGQKGLAWMREELVILRCSLARLRGVLLLILYMPHHLQGHNLFLLHATHFFVPSVTHLLIDTPRPEGICLDALRPEDTRCVQMVNALTLLVRKTFTLTLCVCKKLAASRWQMP